MFQNLSKSCKVVRVQNAAVAGTTNLVGSTVDTSDFECCMFVYGVGTLTATQATKLKAGSGIQSNGSDAADIKGSGCPQGANLADGDSNKLLVLDIVRPAAGPTTSAVTGVPPTGGGVVPNRYLTPTLVRGTANAVVDFGIAILYNKMRNPMQSSEQDTSIGTNAIVTNVSQAQGTAG